MVKNMKHRHFPLFIDSRNKQVLVVGAGKIATRRIQSLLMFDFSITVIAIEARDEVRLLAREKKINLVLRSIDVEDLEYIDYLFLCSDNRILNETYAQMAKEKGILVNVCDNKDLCDFYFPALATKGSLVSGMVGDGTDHKEVAMVAKKIRACLEEIELEN